MFLRNLRLRCFRNLTHIDLDFDQRMHLFTGANGQGKTSILEAIYYLSDLSSFRDVEPLKLIQFGSSQSSLHTELEEDGYQTRLEAHLSWNDETQRLQRLAKINEAAFRSRNAYLQEKFRHSAKGFHSIVFIPSSMQLVYGSPTLRRRYLNRTISSEDPTYFASLMRFERLCEQKAAWIKTGGAQSVWEAINDQWCEAAADILWRRIFWLRKINAPLQEGQSLIAPNQAETTVGYDIKTTRNQSYFYDLSIALKQGYFSLQYDSPSLEDLKTLYQEETKKIFVLERQRGFLLLGPQRDDLKFLVGSVKSKGSELKDTGSQGEVRSTLLALKVAEIKSYRETTEIKPILLVDDFSSELDIERREAILTYLLSTDLQTFVTTTEEVFDLGRTFKVVQGEVVQEKEYGDTSSDERAGLFGR